jgi:hypothetical protein
VTLEDLKALIASANWFARCGEFAGSTDAVTLAAVASDDTWDWLPTSHEQPDPVYGSAPLAEANAAGLGQALRHAELEAAREVSLSLRDTPHPIPALVDGPHDFTWAARGGAEFAARMTAREVVLGRPGFWCRVIKLYAIGHWPCGLVPHGQQLVVL